MIPPRRAGAARRYLVAAAGAALLLVVVFAAARGRRLLDERTPPLLQVELAGCDVVHLPGTGTAYDMAAASVLAGAGRGGREGRWLTLAVTTSPGASVTLLLDGKRVEGMPMDPLPADATDDHDVAAGRAEVELPTVELRIPEGASELLVRAEVEGRRSDLRFPLFTQPRSPAGDELARARKLRNGKETRDEALRVLTQLTSSTDPVVRARAMGQLARAYRGNDRDLAVSQLYAAMALDHDAGLVSDEIGDGLVLVRDLVEQRSDIAAASAVLDRIQGQLREEPVGRALELHYRGLLEEARGDVGGALDLQDQSARLSRRLGLAGHLADVYQKKLVLRARLGVRSEDLRRVLDLEPGPDRDVEPRVRPLPAATPCARAGRAVNLAFYWILRHDAHDLAPEERPLDEARRQLERAVKIYADDCAAPSELRNALTELAQVELAQGHHDAADEALTRARPDPKEARPAHAVEWELTTARVLLERGKPADARPHFETAAALSRGAGLHEHHVTALFGLAETAEALGRTDEALASYASADDELNRWSGLVSFGLGKTNLLDRRHHERSVRRYLGLLVKRAAEGGADRELRRHAACVARRSRARLRVSAEWQRRLSLAPEDVRGRLDEALTRHFQGLSSDQAGKEVDRTASAIGGAPGEGACDAPAEDEILLVYHPLPEGWAGFAVTAADTVVAPPIAIGEEDVQRWRRYGGALSGEAGEPVAAKLLAPFAALLDDPTFKRIRLLPAGPLGGVELHRLPWKKAALGERFAISYGVDASRRPSPPPGPPGRERRALVVAISGKEEGEMLFRAHDEAKLVAESLRRAGFAPTVLEDEAATLDEVERTLEQDDVDLFHYAGHGRRAPGKPDTWDDYLTLAGRQRLTVHQVLRLRRVPRYVLLGSCETDASGDPAFAAGLGVGPAFVLAGSEAVVALAGSPKDQLMMKVMKGLYEGRLRAFLDNPAAAVHETMTALPAAGQLGAELVPAVRVLVR